MKLDIDLTKVASLRTLPDGVIVVRLVSHEIKKSRTGNNKIVFKSQILKPEDVAKDPGTFYFDVSLAETALFKLKQLAEACGCLKEGAFDTNDLMGKEVGLAITLESTAEYGERDKVTQFIPARTAKPGFTEKKEATVAPAAATSGGGVASGIASALAALGGKK